MPFADQDMPMPGFPFGPIMALVFAFIIVIPFWRIFSKAGFTGWLGLLMVVPVANIIALYFLAFSSWPSLRNTIERHRGEPGSVGMPEKRLE